MKTEDEACKLMCVDGSRYLCIASKCMAWRWARHYDDLPDPLNDIHVGYCGLAGNP